MRQDMRKDEYIIRSTDSEEVTHQKEKNFAALYGDSHYSLERETVYVTPVTVVIAQRSRADRERKEAINQFLFAPLLQFVEFGSKVAQFNKGFIKSIAKNLPPGFQFEPYNNPAKKHYTFEMREEILGEIAGDMISSAYGKGFMGELSDGTRVVVRRESETGGPTVEIQVKNHLHKYRY
jgi:hypothetical protein